MAGNGGFRAALDAQIEALSPRDRRLLAGLIVFFGLAMSGGIVWMARSLVDDKASRVRVAKDNLEIIQAIADEYDLAEQKIARAEERLKQFENQPGSAYLESVARNNGVIDQLTVNQQGTEALGTLRQTNFRADLKRVNLQQTLEFLHEIETSGYPITVTMARFKATGPAEAKVIDLTMELASYQMEGK